jgi:hypothetical protein
MLKTLHLAALKNYCIYLLHGLRTHWQFYMHAHKNTRGRYSHASTAHYFRLLYLLLGDCPDNLSPIPASEWHLWQKKAFSFGDWSGNERSLLSLGDQFHSGYHINLIGWLVITFSVGTKRPQSKGVEVTHVFGSRLNHKSVNAKYWPSSTLSSFSHNCHKCRNWTETKWNPRGSEGFFPM